MDDLQMNNSFNSGGSAGDLLASGNTIRQIKTSYHTAVSVQKPRATINAIIADAEKESLISGDEFYYGWGNGKDAIEGPSVKLTNSAVRLYGNCAIETTIEEKSSAYIIHAAFIDLETGFTMTRPFRQSKKWMVYGRMKEERKEDVRFQIGVSKAIRNVCLNALPPILISKMVAAAKKGVRNKIAENIKNSSKAVVINNMTIAFSKVGVSEEMIKDKMHKNLDKLELDDLVCLAGDLRAIQDGADTVDSLFPSNKEEDNAPSVGLKPQKNKSKTNENKSQTADKEAKDLFEKPKDDNEPSDEVIEEILKKEREESN